MALMRALELRNPTYLEFSVRMIPSFSLRFAKVSMSVSRGVWTSAVGQGLRKSKTLFLEADLLRRREVP
jgi:hypothetical protein